MSSELIVQLLTRKKIEANTNFSDRELFRSMPLLDTWQDADLVSVFEYMYNHPRTCIPDSWVNTMQQFRGQLLETCPDPELVDQYNRLVRG